MNGLTGDFDLAVEITSPAIERLVEGMHGAGILRHAFVRTYQSRYVELLINCPQIGLFTAAAPDYVTRAIAVSRVLYHSRSINDSSDAGISAIADVNVRVKLYLTNGDPAPLNANTYLAADWSETTAGDITVYPPNPAIVAEVQGALLDFIADEGGGAYQVPPIGTSPPAGSAAFQFLSGTGSWVAVGLNMGAVVKGSKLQLTNPFVQSGQDWALAISNDYAVSQILSAMNAQLGSLPPPNGPNRVLMSDQSICIVPSPFGGCIASADQKVYLESLNIALQYGQILITGTLSQTTYAVVPITITASFQATATLSIVNQSLQINVSQPAVQLQQWFAQFLNSLLGDALTNAIANGISTAIQSSGGAGSLSSLVSATTLQQLTSLGGPATVDLSVAMNSVGIVPDGIVVQGSLAVQGLFAPPVATAVAVRGPSALTLNLDALGSWSPAHHATEFLWNFGDGSAPVQSNYVVTEVAVAHTWPAAGVYTVTLTVSNESGASTTIEFPVKPGILEILAPKGSILAVPWTVCQQAGDYSITFTVLASGYPAPDAVVVIRTSTNPDQIATGYANSQGQVTFSVNNSMFTTPPPVGRRINPVGGMLVNAFCKDYLWAWNYLWLWNCLFLLDWSPTLLQKFTAEAATLAEFASSPLASAPGLAQDVALTQLTLANLAQLIARGSSVFPLELLFAVKRDASPKEHLEKVAEQAVNNLRELRIAAEKEVQARKKPDKHSQLIDPAKLSPPSTPDREKSYAALIGALRGGALPAAAKPAGVARYKIDPATQAAVREKPVKRGPNQ
jgi:PKD domain